MQLDTTAAWYRRNLKVKLLDASWPVGVIVGSIAWVAESVQGWAICVGYAVGAGLLLAAFAAATVGVPNRIHRGTKARHARSIVKSQYWRALLILPFIPAAIVTWFVNWHPQPNTHEAEIGLFLLAFGLVSILAGIGWGLVPDQYRVAQIQVTDDEVLAATIAEESQKR